MYPTLITIGDISISSFGFMIVIAFLVTNYILKKDFIKFGYNPDINSKIWFPRVVNLLSVMINIILLNPLTKLGKSILRIINKAAITRSFIKVANIIYYLRLIF